MMDSKVFKIAVFPGDGIGPEIMREALKCLAVISETSGVSFQTEEGLVGGAAVDACGTPLPESSTGPGPGKRCRAARGRGRAEVGSASL